MKISLFSRFLPDLEMIARRFPVSVLVCVFMFVFVGLEIEDIVNFNDRQTLQHIYQGGVAAFLASGGVHLLAQWREWSRIKGFSAALLSAIVFAALLVFPQVFAANALMMIPALILWVMIAAFLRPGVSFNVVWLFNSRLAMAIILAVLAGALVAGGISAILASLEYLFHIKIPKDGYEHAISLAVTVVGPLYGLALIPWDIDEELTLPCGDDLMNRGVSILINYVLVPVLLIYVLILHAYAVKIGFSFDLPRGKVGMMVLIFGTGGAATWLIARPWVEDGTRLLKVFTRHWFWFTIVPLVLLVIAVVVRVNEYGVTPERYGLAVVALWLAAMIGYFISKRLEARPQVIIGSMAVLLLLASFGPWGAKGVSVHSQHKRLVTLLETWGYVENGKITDQLPAREKVPNEVKVSSRSIVNFLRKQNELQRLQPLFSGHKENPFEQGHLHGYAVASDINKLFAFNRAVAARKAGRDMVSFRRSSVVGVKIERDSLLSGLFLVRRGANVKFANGGIVKIKDEQLLVTYNGMQRSLAVKELLEKARTAQKVKPRQLVLLVKGEGQPIKLIVNHLIGELGVRGESIRHINFWLLLPVNEKSNLQNSQ